MKYLDKTKATRPLAGVLDHITSLFASGIYIGYMPIASGTWGSLWGPVLYYLLSPGAFGLVLLAGTPVITVLGIAASTRCEQFWGPDPSRVIIDEVAGMLLTLLFLPLSGPVVWAGFFLFRVFDVLKPQPVRWADQCLPGGWGIMLDDLLAGVYANLSLRVLILLVPGLLGVAG